MKVLELKNVSVRYRTEKGFVRAVENVSFDLEKGETLGLVGESGCGKSTLGFAIMKLLPEGTIVEGSIKVDGIDVSSLSNEEMRKIRGSKVSMIFQDPMTSLNPILRIGDHFVEMILTHRPDLSEEEARELAASALEDVGINRNRLRDYPFQFSGGMRQRVMIALSIVLNPAVLIADEPTTSLDVIVQAQIMELLEKLSREHSTSMILITHDMGLVAEAADRIGVMYAGHLVELATKERIFTEPLHPYTVALLESIPNTDINDRELKYIPGSPPDLSNPPKGCRFAPRCEKAMKICREKEPPEFEVDGTRVKCWLYGGDRNGSD
ncbi:MULTISPECIES: ABC transporter ATP-binding protein [Thermotoga]|jgi:peptide/nickel transport system ATP-binding protein|uniref:Oligopeptide/dipeptide ABC transporter, ATPase subunit n=1 Tax=Thermotoga neapolitana (strain ATCC 49049 / DSM 4359 / NBRC 107923 / NS-E) TaxID=309803 RepID=B9K9G6_THENN|nr:MULTISPECIES: ABC transporter ATP-binding protein [Thermotoga]ACM23599.1 Oligopeptide/dipeptide ABC transporter, ATPase subunit [Thermotoga neapolitana DSM 4359]AJG41496.1 peptide ABC transporter ATPase [Thermotoga sp. RQ7]